MPRPVTIPEPPKTRTRADKLPGTMLAGKYKILKKIGEGGMGSVYIANQEPIDRKVAVKVLLGKLAEDEISVRRFEQEARAISKMQHPNTVTIYDFGRTVDAHDEERLYIVMEYLKGRTLTQVLRADGQLSGSRASRILRQVCASLADAHTAGIIHRDLKPDNIFLTEVGGDSDWVKVLDFGVAKLADSESAGTLTQTGMIFGTPKYMSPEQAEGKPLDFRADVYALGVILYELLTGRPPFVADTPVGLLLKHISQPPPPFSELRPDLQVDQRLEAITMKALAKRAEDRFQMVQELAAELEGFQRAATGGDAAPTGTVPTPMASGLPTEVVGSSDSLGAAPKSPDELPPNLSDGVALPTAGSVTAPSHSLATRAVDGSDFADPSIPATSVHETVPGAPSRKPLVFGLIAFLAAGVLAFALTRGDGGSSAVDSVEKLPEPGSAQTSPPVDELAPVAAEEAPRLEPEQKEAAKAEEPEAPKPEPKREPVVRRTPAPPPPKKETPPPTVSMSFESEPTGAVVYLAGEQIGVTPFSTPLERGKRLSFVFKKRGFEQTQKTVVVSSLRKVAVEMERKSSPPRDPKLSLEELQKKAAQEDDGKVSDLK